MFASAKIVYLNVLILFGLLTLILSDCQIEIPVDRNLRPTYYKFVGSIKIKINTNSVQMLKLHQLQKIEAYCDTKFEQPSAYKTSNKIYITCKGDYSSRLNLQCAQLKWSLYESYFNFVWCPFNLTSYILARHELSDSTPSLYNYLAGICYDVYNSSFYSVYYTLAPNGTQNNQPLILGDLYKPDISIEYIKETFGSNSISGNVYDDYQFENWVSISKYDFSSIIQHQKLYSTHHIEKFNALLEFLWWSNLRLYNWQRYINALQQHVENDNQIYDILAGVSGAIKVPIINSCLRNYTMEEVVFNTNRKIPLYVWNYLQNRANSSNEVVIIGFNSPFDEFYSQEDVIFCTDRCHEIPWLKEVRSSFRYKIMGFIICCNVEDVRLSNRLYGFPERDINPKAVEMTELPNAFDEEQTETTDSEITDDFVF